MSEFSQNAGLNASFRMEPGTRDDSITDQEKDIPPSSFERRAEIREVPISKDSKLVRLERQLKLESSIEKAEEGRDLDGEDVRRLKGALEARGWHRMFAKVRAGDLLATFVVPSGSLGTKRLNDVVFGMQKMDDVIGLRHTFLRGELERAGLERLWTTHRDEEFLLSAKRVSEDVDEKLNVCAENVRRHMTEALMFIGIEEWRKGDGERRKIFDTFFKDLLGEDERVVEAFHRGFADVVSATEVTERQAKIQTSCEVTYRRAQHLGGASLEQAYEDFENAKVLLSAAIETLKTTKKHFREEVVLLALKDATKGYRVTFGTAKVGESKNEGDYTEIEKAVLSSTKGAMMARKGEVHGKEFSSEDEKMVVEEWKRLHEKLAEEELVDDRGRSVPLFILLPNGSRRVNANIVRDVRKGVFRAASGQERVIEDFTAYLEALNVFDNTKPYTHGELQGEAVSGDGRVLKQIVEDTVSCVSKMEADHLDADALKEISSLRREGKDRSCTSALEFHAKALEIPDCVYVSMDVLDVGVELLQEFELLMKSVDRGEMSFDEAQCIAGDRTTESMRAFREKVSRIYRESFGGDPLMLVGGDEIVLAMNKRKATDELMLSLRKLRFGARKTSSVRVVKIAIGSSERSSDIEDVDRTKREHLDAIRRSEDGVAIAKGLEKIGRSILFEINDLPRSERGTWRRKLSDCGVEDFAILQRADSQEFEIALPNSDGEPVRREVVSLLQKRLDDLFESVTIEVQKRRADMLQHLQSMDLHVDERRSSILLRRLNEVDGDVKNQDFLRAVEHFSA